MGKGRIELIEHTADVAMRVTAGDLPSLFELAVEGLYQIVGQLRGTGELHEYQISLSAEGLDDVFHDWLAEVLYSLDVRKTVIQQCEFHHITERGMEAKVVGRQLDTGRSIIRTEIKAVTYHHLVIRRIGEEFVVTVVFDV